MNFQPLNSGTRSLAIAAGQKWDTVNSSGFKMFLKDRVVLSGMTTMSRGGALLHSSWEKNEAES